MKETREIKILRILRDSLPLPNMVKPKSDPFQTLIVTIISQNTSDLNTERAFESLSKHFEINPRTLSTARTSQIEACLQLAGLYHAKAKVIRETSKIIIEKFDGTLAPVLILPLEEARKALMELPGVGPKTADVVLLFSAGKPTVPVDTHVNRISKRLGLAPENGDYDAVRLSLQSLFDPKDYLSVHLVLIAHGRKTCKARHPQCHDCLVYEYCPSNYLGDCAS